LGVPIHLACALINLVDVAIQWSNKVKYRIWDSICGNFCRFE